MRKYRPIKRRPPEIIKMLDLMRTRRANEEKRKNVLKQLENGEITFSEALEKIGHEKEITLV